MSQNSSTSSSESARYLALLAGLTLSLVILTWGFTKATLWAGRSQLPFQTLVEYQFAKAKTAPPPETVFVGDSSLGNAIDARYWQALSGQVTSNLALTGAFGYVGSFSMLRETLKRGKPKNVIVVQTADMLMRTSAEENWISALDPKPEGLLSYLAHEWHALLNVQEVTNALSWLGDLALKDKSARKEAARLFKSNLEAALGVCDDCRAATPRTVLDNDYIRQGPPRTFPADVEGYDPARIRPEKTAYLEQIVALCRDESLNCLYVYGPLTEPIWSKSPPYFSRSSDTIRKTGITLVQDEPFVLTPEQTGDSGDHVAPPYKQAFTEKYFELLKPYLKQSVAVAEQRDR